MAVNLYAKSLAAGAPPGMVVCEPSDARAALFVDTVRAKIGADAADRVVRVATPSECVNTWRR
jgi:hypothetical protein